MLAQQGPNLFRPAVRDLAIGTGDRVASPVIKWAPLTKAHQAE